MATKATLLILWMLITLILTFSVIGMLLFVGKTDSYTHGKSDFRRSSWMSIGVKLLDSIINEK